MNKLKKYEEYTNEEFARLSYEEKEEIKGRYYLRKAGKFTLIGTVGIFAFVTIIKSFTTIPTGYVGVKTRFGQVQDTVIQEGLNFKMPYVEKIVKIDCKTQKCEYEMEASSKDLQKVSNIKVAVNYNVDKSKANTSRRVHAISARWQTVRRSLARNCRFPSASASILRLRSVPALSRRQHRLVTMSFRLQVRCGKSRWNCAIAFR